jgi:hypothetical protein
VLSAIVLQQLPSCSRLNLWQPRFCFSTGNRRYLVFPQRRIPWHNHYWFWLFNYEIIRHANLFSNRLSYVREKDGASATVIVSVTQNSWCFSHSWPSIHLRAGCDIFICTQGWGCDVRSGRKSNTAKLYWQICGYLVTILNPTNLYEIINAGWYTDAYCNSSTGLDCYVISPSYTVLVSILPDEFPFWIYNEYFHRPPRRK